MPNRPGARYKSSVGRKGSKGPFAQDRVDLLPSALVMHGRPWRKFPLRRERVRSIHDQSQACQNSSTIHRDVFSLPQARHCGGQ
jgi:hypothetical protein